MKQQEKKLKVRGNATYLPEDYEWLRKIAFENRTSMSYIIRYMIHYFRDNKLQIRFPSK